MDDLRLIGQVSNTKGVDDNRRAKVWQNAAATNTEQTNQKPWLRACSELASLTFEDCAVMPVLDTEHACTRGKDRIEFRPLFRSSRSRSL